MCELYKKSDQSIHIGWKVVVVKDNKFYSPFTAIEYKNKQPIEIPKEQKHLLGPEYFFDFLNPNNTHHNPNMIGKTAIFLVKDGAVKLKNHLNRFSCEHVEVVKASVTYNCMLGWYGDEPVAAGEFIDFI